MTYLLAIDTATRFATVAVGTRNSVDAHIVGDTWHSKHNHGVELLAKVNEYISDAGITISDITHIAVVTGPGSFSALRVGLATAQGLALAQEIPLLPVPTFELEVEPWSDRDVPVCAVVDAGSSGVAWGLSIPGKNGRVIERNGLDTFEDCAAVCPDDTLFCGESAQKITDNVSPARILSHGAPTRSAESLINLAFRKLDGGQALDPSKVEITYARAPSTTTPKVRLPDGSRPRKPDKK